MVLSLNDNCLLTIHYIAGARRMEKNRLTEVVHRSAVLDDITLDTLISPADSLSRNRSPLQTTPVRRLSRVRIR